MMTVWRVNLGLLTEHNCYCALMIATHGHISYCQKIRCFLKMNTSWSFILVLFVSSANTSSIKKGSTSKRLKLFCEFLWFHNWKSAPAFPRPGLSISIETSARNIKVDIMLIQTPSEHMNAWVNPAQTIIESYEGILLHYNFISCKGFSWITSGPPPQKEGNTGYRPASQYVVYIFVTNWTMHILDQVFLRKNVDYIPYCES